MDISRRKVLMNAFFRSQFNYCLLIWICYNRSLNHKINWLHENVVQSLIAIINLALINCLIKLNLSLFTSKISKNLVSKRTKFLTEKTLKLWMKFFVSWMRPLNNFDKDRIFISFHLYFENIRDFKTAIKRWKPTSQPYRVCKTYLYIVGFL